MKRKLAILAAATMLVLVLAVPASASRSFPIEGTMYAEEYEEFGTTQVGPLCLVTAVQDIVWLGSIEGTGINHYRSLSHGAADCTLGPIYDETYHEEGVIDATILGRQGTIHYNCQGQHHADEPAYFEEHCAVLSATGGLAGLHAVWEMNTPLATWTCSYQGTAHFDPAK